MLPISRQPVRWVPAGLLLAIAGSCLLSGLGENRSPDRRPAHPLAVSPTPTIWPEAAPAQPVIRPQPAPAAGAPARDLPQEATSPPPSAPSGDIPGIESGSLVESLRRSGLVCVSAIRDHLLSWTCSGRGQGGLEYGVAFSGPGTAFLDTLSATIEQRRGTPSDVRAALFLGSVAAIDYEGAQPQRAREWVSAHIAQGGRTTLGAVTFELSGAPAIRTLEMRARKER